MIATIAEGKVQRSQRSYGNHSPAIAATTVAEIDLSSISAIVAIIWKPLFSDHSYRSVPRCIAYANAFQDGCQHKHWESNRLGPFYGGSTKKRLSLQQIIFQRNTETSTGKSTAGKQSECNSIKVLTMSSLYFPSSSMLKNTHNYKKTRLM